MKKTLLTLIAVLMTTFVAARPVNPAMARRVAETFLSAQGMRNTGNLQDVTAQTPFTSFYIFAAQDGGFIIVSADDCVMPVLGYSTTSSFVTKDMPENLAGWLGMLEQEINLYRGIVDMPTNDIIVNQWTMLASGQMYDPPLNTAVSPLLTTTWNQSPYYNSQCPYDNSQGTNTPTGCTATATAQVMKYWNHPTTGYGSNSYTSVRDINGTTYTYGPLSANFGATTYQWSNMPNALDAYSTQTQINAVAQLMYHIGVATEMNYSPSASGAQIYQTNGMISRSAQNALNAYFKYCPDMAALCREDYSNQDFCNLLYAELDQSRPILYSGFDQTGGHSFVLDGYNNLGQFHINWGWGSSCDGYYNIGSLNPGGSGTGGNSTYTFNLSNVALTGIRPNNSWSSTSTTTVTTSTTGGAGCSVSGGGSHPFGDTVTLSAMAAQGYHFDSWSDGSKFNPRQFVATGGSYNITAHFVAVTGDTITYCPGNHNINRYGYANGNAVWGVKYPSSLFSETTGLNAVQLYVGEAGTYTMTVYTGANHSTVAATTTATFSSSDVGQWKTIALNQPVNASAGLWIIFTSTASYPATYTYGSGVAGSFLWGDNFYEGGIAWGVTAMIKAILCSTGLQPPSVEASAPAQAATNTNVTFSSTVAPSGTVTWNFPGGNPATATGANANSKWETPGIHMGIATATNAGGSSSDTAYVLIVDYNAGDTISYCLDRPQWGNVGYEGTSYWGVSFPKKYLENRDSITEVLLYVAREGDYTLSIYSGTNIKPVTLLYTDSYYFDSVGDYVSCTLDNPVPVNKNQYLWVTFSYPYTTYPIMGCEYVDEPNSDWISSNGTTWNHLRSVAPNLAMTYLIKTVTKAARSSYDITVLSDNPDMGDVSGSGTYPAGSTATISANAKAGYLFSHWQDGNSQNPRDITVNSDATYTAFFVNADGIEDVADVRFDVTVENHTIHVAADGPASLFDLQGRLLATGNEFNVETTGAYLVRLGTMTRKVVVK